MERRLAPRRSMPIWLKILLLAVVLLVYVGIAAAVVFFVSRNGAYPTGSDTMFYVYRGDFLYRSIAQEGNWYPLIDMQWYNGVQTWRYWSPLSALIYAACQAVMGGSSMDGYLLCCGVFYLLNALSWFILGLTHRRPWMGAFLGLIWFFVPGNSFMFFAEGVMARAMSMAVLPWFVVGVYDYLYRPREKKWPAFIQIIVSMLFIIMSHVGWAGMLAITLLIYLLFYVLVNPHRKERTPVWPILVCVLLSFLITGIWLYPSLKGGITGIDSSSIMKNFFQPLLRSIDPFGGVSADGHWNRWLNASSQMDPYFGCVAFLLGLFGCLFSRRTVFPGFATAISVCLLTTTAAYPILVYLPGAQYLWMLRFISLALTFLLTGFFFWTSLKRGWQVLFALLLVLECVQAFPLFLRDQTGLQPRERYSAMCEATLIDVGRANTTQRFSAVEPGASVPEGAYLIAGFGGDEAVPTSFGQGVQAAQQYRNIVQIDQAAEDGQYLYLFDRLLELGNDTVLIPMAGLDPIYADDRVMDDAAARSGYRLLAQNGDYRLYKLQNAPEHFGMVSKYRAIAIGSGSGDLALGFPAVEETSNIYLDEYTYEDLSQYDVIYLAGFTYHDLPTAEDLILRLSEAGKRVVILADGIPADEHTGSKSFLGVSCNAVNFQNGYPALDTVDGVLYCDLFASGHSKDWKTVYLNGLSDVWGTITDVPEGRMDFYGTGKNENIVYIGLALTYHYALTRDPAVGALLSHALTISSSELPQRELVPLSIDYHHNVITIDAPQDGVNTTLAFHDIFDADRDVDVQHNLLVVDQGRTVIRLRYPYLVPGLCLSTVGVVATVAYLIVMKKRLKTPAVKAAQTEPGGPPPDQESKKAPVQ